MMSRIRLGSNSIYGSTPITIVLTLVVASHVATRYGSTEDRHLHNPEKYNYPQSSLMYQAGANIRLELTTKTKLHANT